MNPAFQMKTAPRPSGALRWWWCFILLPSAFCLRAPGQSYSIDWFTVDGGGGTSTGGVYSVSGTIGQPDAGAMRGGQFTLTGGFWSVIAIQSPGAPLLTIERTATNSVIVSWPAPATGWRLQENADFNPANWTSVATSPQEVAGRKQVTVSPPVGNRFYRLHKP